MSVVVQNLTKQYANATSAAVSGVTFEAPTGAITSLIGPSGAGKSTVLRVIAGLEYPDQGAVRVDDVDLLAVPVRERGVGLVFQNYALFRNMTVRENVAFGLDVRKRPKGEIAARVSELLKLVQLEKHADKRPAQLSGGEKQRVAFARALAIEPKVLLLDEPFGALDARVRRELRDWLTELHERTQVTTLIVTHDQEEALEISQHVVVMFDGKVAQVGPPKAIYDRPATPEVASFLGANVLRREGPLGAATYVRPEDVKLARELSAAHQDDADRIRAGRIERVRVIGPRVRVALVLNDGERVTVDAGRAEFDNLGVAAGESLFVDLRAARVFVEDYTI